MLNINYILKCSMLKLYVTQINTDHLWKMDNISKEGKDRLIV